MPECSGCRVNQQQSSRGGGDYRRCAFRSRRSRAWPNQRPGSVVARLREERAGMARIGEAARHSKEAIGDIVAVSERRASAVGGGSQVACEVVGVGLLGFLAMYTQASAFVLSVRRTCNRTRR